MLKLYRDEVDKLYYKGELNTYRVMEFDTEEITDIMNTVVIKDEKTGKFYRGHFLQSQDEVDFEEVKQVPSITYEPVDK